MLAVTHSSGGSPSASFGSIGVVLPRFSEFASLVFRGSRGQIPNQPESRQRSRIP